MRPTGRMLSWASVGMLTMLLLGLGLMIPTPAAAHDEMTASTPEDGATLDEAPEAMKLEFSGALQQMGSEVQVTSGDENVTVDEPVIAGQTITSALPDEMPAGKYKVVWRVVSSDGHPISGESAFTITSNKTGKPAPASTKTEHNVADNETATTTPAAADASNEASDSGISLTLVILLGLGVAAIIVIVTIIVIRKDERSINR